MLKMMIEAITIAISLKKQGVFHGCEVTLGNSGKVLTIPEDITLEKLEGCKKFLEAQLKEDEPDPVPPSSSAAATAHAK